MPRKEARLKAEQEAAARKAAEEEATEIRAGGRSTKGAEERLKVEQEAAAREPRKSDGGQQAQGQLVEPICSQWRHAAWRQWPPWALARFIFWES